MAQTTIESSRIKVGSCFSEPVYFDDGQNMFLADHHPAKQYHVAALKRWNVPFLLTSGVEIDYNQYLAEKKSKEQARSVSAKAVSDEDVEDLEELEELEEL